MEDTTEHKIKEAAKGLFLEKGFKATSIREIAAVANVNSAMLHYYFRNKEKLFEIVMLESLYEVMFSVRTIAADTQTNLSQKIELMIDRYFDMMGKNPRLFPFVINELTENSVYLISKSGIPNKMLTGSSLFTQLCEHLKNKQISVSPFHFLMNMISMSIMPFGAKPLIVHLSDMNTEELQEFLAERKRLIPIWIKAMLQIND